MDKNKQKKNTKNWNKIEAQQKLMITRVDVFQPSRDLSVSIKFTVNGTIKVIDGKAVCEKTNSLLEITITLHAVIHGVFSLWSYANWFSCLQSLKNEKFSFSQHETARDSITRHEWEKYERGNLLLLSSSRIAPKCYLKALPWAQHCESLDESSTKLAMWRIKYFSMPVDSVSNVMSWNEKRH